MKSFLTCVLPFLGFVILSEQPGPQPDPSPLSVFSSQWNDARFQKCNTAASTSYLTTEERKLIYILNLLRTDPELFASTVVEKYPDYISQPHLKTIPEFQSLLDTLRRIQPLAMLYPDSLCFESAKCHAITAGQKGYVGHERQTDDCKAKKHHMGECCQYGYDKALYVLMALLIDQNTPSLGHRFLCLSSYGRIGVSIQPHQQFGTNAVLDFYY